MTSRRRPPTHRGRLSLAVAVLLSACAIPSSQQPPTPAEPAKPVAIQPVYGAAQRFSRCSGDCIAPTPKTVGSSQAMVQAVAPQPAPPPAAPEARTERHSITFAFNSAQLSESALASLRQLATRLQGAKTIRITGFTDNLGPQSPNTRLAEARAVVVMQALRDLAPDLAAELRARGQALCCYRSDNKTEAGRESNRRAELEATWPVGGPPPKSQQAQLIAPPPVATRKVADSAVTDPKDPS